MKARTVVGRGEEGLQCGPGFELHWEGAREQCEDNKWDEQRKTKSRHGGDQVVTFEYY